MTKLLVLCLSIWSSVPAWGMTVEADWVAAQLQAAPLVADLEVLGKVCSADPVFHTTCQISARLLAVTSHQADPTLPGVGDTISLWQIGGERNEVGVSIPGMPHPFVGKQYHAYLKRHDSQTFEVAGFENGLRPLRATRNWSRNRTDGSNGDGTGPFLYWADSYFPLPYFVSSTTFQGLPTFPAAIDASFQTWHNVKDSKVEYVGLGCTSVSQAQNDGINSVLLMTSNWPYDPSIIALTRNFYVSGTSPQAGMILDSDIMLNGVYHQFTTTNEEGKNDVQNIVTHEAGHVVGLGHETMPYDETATMFATAQPNEFIKRTLKEDDITALKDGYGGTGKKYDFPHLSCSVSDSAAATGSVGCAAVHTMRAPNAWGLLQWTLFCLALVQLAKWAAGKANVSA